VSAREEEESGFKGFRLVNKLTGETQEVGLSGYTYLWGIDCSPRAGLILAVTQDSEKSQILIFKRDGSAERKLIEENERIYSARWSPSGDSIYFLQGKGSTSEIARIRINGKAEPVAIASGLETTGFFTLTADGSRLAYTRGHYYSNLWQVRLQPVAKEKAELSQITSGTSYYVPPSFSPDGKWIAFALGANDAENIFKMQTAGSEPMQLTYFGHAMTSSPAWSPDGQRIAFVSDQNGTPRVWTISANGGAPQPLEETNASNTNMQLAWWPSPDIVYQKSGLRNYLRISGSAQTAVLPQESGGWVPHKPRFSPDGNKVAVFLNRQPEKGLCIISLEPYSETFMLAGSIYPLGWSPDGKYVYVVRQGGGEISRVRSAPPDEISSVAVLPGDIVYYDSASVSPDGRQIIVSVGHRESDVWLMENLSHGSANPN
jgi:dipeptidyl aminopeptidase/acylaminoacyl peptidase